MSFLLRAAAASWGLFLESAPYVLFGIGVAGLLRAFVNPNGICAHLGRGRVLSVVKAALFGIPLPLCSCGVLPAAVSLRKQGANRGATTAFLIATPESGIDSISISYALLDPLMTVARPLAAFVTAVAAGLAENFLGRDSGPEAAAPDISCPVDGCCDGNGCPPEIHRNHHKLPEKLLAGLSHAHREVWADMAGWFFAGLALAGVITALIPADALSRYLGGGILSYLLMLGVGIPIYICATASTPVAAALILAGVSPGAALVFLLAGPATNVTSISVLLGILGKRATAVYLSSIAVFSVLAGFLLDRAYVFFGVSARALAGKSAEILPHWLSIACAAALLALSVRPLLQRFRGDGSRAPGKTKSEAASCASAA